MSTTIASRGVATSIGAVEADDAAEGDKRVGVARAHVGVRGRVTVAAPHGFVCLITAAAGSSNSSTMRAAASRSSRLVYDSSLPCSTVARRRPCRRGASAYQRRRSGAGFRRNAGRASCRSDDATSPAAPATPVARRARSRSPSSVTVGQRRRNRRVVAGRCARTLCAPGRIGTRRRAACRSSCVEHRARSHPATRPRARRWKFLAAARTRLGPPMSISSISASNGVSGFGGGFHKRIQIDDDEIDQA